MEYEPDNIIALCFGCHFHWWHNHPLDAADWINDKMPERMKQLKLMANTGAGSREYKLLKIYLNQKLKELK